MEKCINHCRLLTLNNLDIPIPFYHTVVEISQSHPKSSVVANQLQEPHTSQSVLTVQTLPSSWWLTCVSTCVQSKRCLDQKVMCVLVLL